MALKTQRIYDEDITIGSSLSLAADFDLEESEFGPNDEEFGFNKDDDQIRISPDSLAYVHAHVKHAALISQDIQRGHRPRDHYNWARENPIRRVMESIEAHLDTIDTRTRCNLVDVNNLSHVMGWMKEARLIAENDRYPTGHQLRHHIGWARGQTVARVKRSIKENVATVQDVLGFSS